MDNLNQDLINSTNSDEYDASGLSSSPYSITSWFLDLLMGTNSSRVSDTVEEANDFEMSLNESVPDEKSPQEHEKNSSTQEIYALINEVKYALIDKCLKSHTEATEGEGLVDKPTLQGDPSGL